MQTELGDQVIDAVSGLEGVAVTYTASLDGSIGFFVQPAVGDDGKRPSTQYCNSANLVVKTKGFAAANRDALEAQCQAAATP